ncbi:MAG: thermonuclease family protein [Chlorobia bacterium]|nr:thermonuclease family protein [Fimbriimonadaceae bacterium]
MKESHLFTKWLGTLVVLASFSGCQPAPPPVALAPLVSSTKEPNYAPGDYYVDHIVNGDTLWLRKGEATIKVRLLRVDTPELNEFGFKEATDELQRQIGDESKIQLEFEEERLDPHGRTLAYLFIDGKNVNLEMVRSGWSPFFDRYGKGRYSQEFESAESEAIQAKAGLFANR